MRMKKKYQRLKNIFFCMLLICICQGNVHAQDLHFSQYFNAPLLINPANTGFAPDKDWRVGINYRNQWAGILTNPYKTMSAWGDAQIFNNRFENGWMGIGGSILKDVAGSGNLSSTKLNASVAYHQLIGYKSLLSGGFALGGVNKRIDVSKLSFDNQWNGKFFDITLPSGETFSTNSVWYFDLQAGLNYAWFPSDNTYINAGFSAAHINRPKESFFKNTIADTRLSVRYNYFLNGSFKVNDQWIVNPNIYYSAMAKANETVLGMNAHYNLSGDGNTQLVGGLYYRVKDAVIPMVGYQWNGLMLTVNYDVNAGSSITYSESRGAYELSIVKTGLFNPAGKSVKCPTVAF